MKRRWRWVLLAVVLATPAILGAALSYRNRPLLQRATPVGGQTKEWYIWRSPREMLFVHTDSGHQTSGGEMMDLSARLVDVRSGTSRPVLHLGGMLPNPEDPDISSMTVSPDGTWLLYLTQYQSASGNWLEPGFRAAEIDGDRTYTWPVLDSYDRSTVRDPTWLPDSHRWIELTTGARTLLYLRSLDTDAHRPTYLPPDRTASAILGITPDHRLIVHTNARGTGYGTGTVELAEISVPPNSSPTRFHRVTAARGGIIREVAVSPTGDRLASLVEITHYPPGYQLLARLLPALARRISPTTGIELRVSRLDGSADRQIGFEPSSASDLTHIRWRPDGHAVSFAGGDAAYQIDPD